MLIGIMSDSHGDLAATSAAVKLLQDRGAEQLLHCGDIGTEQVVNALNETGCTFVWGNCDLSSIDELNDDPADRARSAAKAHRIELAGKRIGLYHGHEGDFLKLIASNNGHPPETDYVFFGHSHKYTDFRRNGCRFINPGALYRVSIRTVALLDLDTDKLTIVNIDTGGTVKAD